MKIEVKFNCKDLVGDLRDGIYESGENATVAEILDLAQREAGRELSESVKKSLVFMLNSRHADWDAVVNDGDKLRVLYKILGG